jgi:serine/threonine protein phosphatase PrpC
MLPFIQRVLHKSSSQVNQAWWSSWRCLQAVYDGHDGSAASNMLSQDLHTVLYSSAAAVWASKCSLHAPVLQAAVTAAAQRLNNAFLTRARQAASGKTSGSSSNDAQSSLLQPPWDGHGGSTAVFAMLAGQQVLIGNVGNSKAILCSSSSSSSSSVRHPTSSSGSTTVMTYQSALSAEPPSPSTAALQQRMQQRSSTSSGSSSGPAVTRQRGGCSQLLPAGLHALNMTSDHVATREDEAARIKKAGGQITVNPATPGGKLRVRGELEVTRSFGDLDFQDQGVTALPE